TGVQTCALPILRGQAPNTAGAGSKIRLLGGPVPVQQKEVVLGGNYLSGSDPLYTFAAGNATELTIEVDWRRGGRSVIHGVKSNREYEIREPPIPPSLRPGSAPAPSPLVPRCLCRAWSPPCGDALQRLGPPALAATGAEPARPRCYVVRRRRRRK